MRKGNKHERGQDIMAKIRNNVNSTAHVRASQSSKKPDKWQGLRGWVTTDDTDDTDIETWANRRKQLSDFRVTSKSQSRVDVGRMFSTLTALCQSIEDVTVFKDNSLCETLHPYRKSNRDFNSRGQPVRPTFGSNRSASEADNKIGVNNVDNTSGSTRESSETTTPDGICHQSEVNGDNEADNGNGNTTSTGSRDQRLALFSRGANKVESRESSDDKQENSDEKNPEECKFQDAYRDHGNPLADDHDNEDSRDIGHVNDRPELPRRTIKLSYTQSNITLRDPYWISDDTFEERPRNQPPDPYPEAQSRHSSECRSPCSDVSRGGTSWKCSNHNTTHSRVTLNPEGEKADIGNFSQTLNDSSTFITGSEASVGGVGIGCLKSCQIKHDSPDPKKSLTPNRQMSLVLKKVSIQDSGIRDESSKPHHATTPLLSRSATRRRINGFVSKSDSSPINRMVALGELLPAVDKNIKSRMFQGVNTKTPPDPEVDEEIYVLDKDSGMPIKDKQLSYEDSLIVMKEGLELIRIKERQPSILGPPAFRPQPNKTPLQRAKENSSKRIYGQLNYTGNISYSDMNRLRWKSSSGTLYTGSKLASDTESETKSAPATANSEETILHQSSGYRSQFYGFTTAESCPDSLSAALIKAGIDPVNNLYHLSKRRKPPPGRPLGGYMAYHAANSNNYMSTGNTSTSSDSFASNLTEVDLSHIRGKVGPKMTEIIRRRARGVEVHDEPKS